MMDYTNYPKTNTFYGGSEKKIGISIGGFEYMLKFRIDTPMKRRCNHVCEYLGSHVYELLGFNVHETFLGTYDGEEVVACKNFITKDVQFVPFNDVGESSLERDKETYQYSYDDIMLMLRDNTKLTDVQETVERFWEMYVVDALIGNFDRHGANWGFLKQHNKYTLAPVFDNGSSLFPQLVDDDLMERIMNSEELTNDRIYKFPLSQVKLNGDKSSYFEVINSLQYNECNAAVIKVCKRYNQSKIDKLVDKIEIVTDMHKRFFKYMLEQRFEKILLPAYSKLTEI